MSARQAKIFWSGRSQAVRLPKEFRFEGEAVSVRRVGESVILEPLDTWPEGYFKSFAGVSGDFKRPPQGKTDQREPL